MANAHSPKPGLRSPAAKEGNYPCPSFPRATHLHSFATTIEQISTLRTDPFQAAIKNFAALLVSDARCIRIGLIKQLVRLGICGTYVGAGLTVLPFLSPQRACAEEAFSVRGSCTFEQRNINGLITESNLVNFEALVDGCKCAILINDLGEDVDYRKIVTDETTTYYITVFESSVNRRKKAGEVVGENIAAATALRRPVPNLSSYSHAGPIWLSYGSRCYFKSRTNKAMSGAQLKSPIDLASGVGTDSGFFVEQLSVVRLANWMLNGEGGLPNMVVYYEPAKSGIGLASGDVGGLTNSVYETVQFTNIAGIAVPLESVFKTYWLGPGKFTPAKPLERFVFRIRSERFVVGRERLNEVLLPPELPGKTLVSEGRFVEDSVKPKASWSYMSEVRFPTEEKVRSTPDYVNAPTPSPPKAIIKGDARGIPRYFIIIIFMIIFIIPCIVFLRSKYAGK